MAVCSTYIISKIKRDIGRKSRFFILHLRQGGGVPVSYPMVKNIVIRPTRFDTIQERVRKQDIHTDGQTGTGRDIQGAAKKRSRLFKCSLDHAKKSYLSANATFGKVGRVTSEEVTLQLIKSKCIPVLL